MGFSLAKLKPENWSRDIAMDLGTASVLVFVEGKGIVLNEPSVVAVDDTTTDRVVKVGRSAMEMLGRTPEHIEATRPLADGTMTQYEVTPGCSNISSAAPAGGCGFPARHHLRPGPVSARCRCAPSWMPRGRRARAAPTLSTSRAAALGARLKFRSPVGHMIVNIGGGISNVAVLSMGGVVVSDNIPVGGIGSTRRS